VGVPVGQEKQICFYYRSYNSPAAYKKARLIHVDSDFELVSTEVDLEEERIK
jgi:hypothetical protein